MNKSNIDYLKSAFEQLYGKPVASHKVLPKSGSGRSYVRLIADNIQVIGMFNPDLQENDVFQYTQSVFLEHGVKVPEIYHYSNDKQYMLLQDLGDETLFSCIGKESTQNLFSKLLPNAIDILIRLQTEVSASYDFKKCYPVKAFTRRSYYWDLNYFKYCFLRLQNLGLEEDALEDDFEHLVNKLSSDDIPHAIVHRDYQSRNLMVFEGELYVIDFQAARKGPVWYDVVSLLWQAKANLSDGVKEQLSKYYLQRFAENRQVDAQVLERAYLYFVLFRVLQVLGAYGLRGLHEHKLHFLQSIPFAIDNLRYVFSKWPLLKEELPALSSIAAHLSSIKHHYVIEAEASDSNDLLINIASFSYKNGYPVDYSMHGGGFVFDCRSLPNPGRLDAYKTKSGLDSSVVEWLETHEEVEAFYRRVEKVVEEAKEVYKTRAFNYLAVNFGCTGGQHRSVYMAERLSKKLKSMPGIQVRVNHKNSHAWPKT